MTPSEGGHFAPRDEASSRATSHTSQPHRSGRRPYDWLDDASYAESSAFSSDELLSLSGDGVKQLQNHPGYSSQFSRITVNAADDAPGCLDEQHTARITQAKRSTQTQAAQRIPASFSRRKRTGTIVGLIVALLCICVLVFVCYKVIWPKVMGYDFYAATTSDNEIDQEINTTITLLTTSDETIVPLDNLVQAPIDPKSATEIDGVLNKKEETLSVLAQAKEHVDHAGSMANPTDEQRKLIRSLQTSVQARQQMMEAGAHILTTDKAVAGSQADLVKSYKLMVEADEYARKALEASNQYAEARNKAAEEARSTGEVHASTDELQKKATEAANNSKQALETITNALNLVTEVHKKYPEPEVLAIKEYLDERVKAMTLSSEADELVAQDKLEDAQTKIDEYNKLDAQVTELSTKIADDPTKLLSAVYERLTKTDLATYNQARSSAAESDAVIRTYQGIRVSPQGMKVDDAQKK